MGPQTYDGFHKQTNLFVSGYGQLIAFVCVVIGCAVGMRLRSPRTGLIIATLPSVALFFWLLFFVLASAVLNIGSLRPEASAISGLVMPVALALLYAVADYFMVLIPFFMFFKFTLSTNRDPHTRWSARHWAMLAVILLAYTGLP